MLRNKMILVWNFAKYNLTIVVVLNAEPKSMPITGPNDVSIRKLNEQKLVYNTFSIFNILHLMSISSSKYVMICVHKTA
jgi:hypothetical protein